MQTTRREVLRLIPITGGAYLLASCTTAQANAFISDLNVVVVAIQSALPIVEVLVPPPYAAAISLAGTFLNLANVAAEQTATILSNGQPAASQAAAILKVWAGVALDPAVYAKLPPTIGTNNVNTANLITAVVNSVNALLNSIAVQAGVTVQPPTATDAVVQVPAVLPSLSLKLPSNPFKIDKNKLAGVLATAQGNQAILATHAR